MDGHSEPDISSICIHHYFPSMSSYMMTTMFIAIRGTVLESVVRVERCIGNKDDTYFA